MEEVEIENSLDGKFSDGAIPFEISRFIFLPAKKLRGVLIKVKSRRNVLKKISSWITESGLRPIFVHFQGVNHEYEVIRVLFDYTNSNISPEKFVTELTKLEDLIDIKMFTPEIEGFLPDIVSYPLLMSGARTVIFRKPVYEGLLVGLRERFGSGGEAFLYHIGFEIGKRAGKSHREIARQLRVINPLEILRQISANLFKCAGFGVAQIIDSDSTVKPPQLTIRVEDSFECSLSSNEKKPYSHFTRGMLAGIVTELFGTPATATETKCIAEGHPYCEFIIKPENVKIKAENQ